MHLRGNCWSPGSNPEFATWDHIVPKSKGGTNDRSNVKLAHRRCNELRGNSDPEIA